MIQPTDPPTTTFQAKFSQAYREFVRNNPHSAPSDSRGHQAFAQHLNFPAGHIINWLNGNRLPEAKHIQQLAQKLGNHVYTWFNDQPESMGHVDFIGKPYAVTRPPRNEIPSEPQQTPRYRSACIVRANSDYFELGGKVILAGKEYEVLTIQARVDTAGCLWLKIDLQDNTKTYHHQTTYAGTWQVAWGDERG